MKTYLSDNRSDHFCTSIRQKEKLNYFWHIVFGVIIFFLSASFLAGSVKNIRLRYYAISINEEIAELRRESIEMEEQIRAMQTDPFYRESVIRQELKMGKAGEVIIQ